MSDHAVVMQITRMEALHLSGLVAQFVDLLRTGSPAADPAVARLVPDAYESPTEAAEFRSATEADLLDRRRADALRVLDSLGDALPASDDSDDPTLLESVPVLLTDDDARAWLRTLAALRLILASRLGIEDESDDDPDDPRFGVYEWVGYRLDGLVRALDGG